MRKYLPALLLCTTILGLVLWYRAERNLDKAQQLIAKLERARGIVPAPAGSPATPVPADTPAGERIVHVPAGAKPEEYIRVVDNKAIDELNATVADLRQQLTAATEESQKLNAAVTGKAEEQAKLTTQLDDLRENLRQAKNTATGLQAELQTKTDRTAAAEAAQKAMADRLARAEAAAAKTTANAREVEDLNRRREVQITNLQRRYRDITDTYRAFALNAQNREQAGAANPAGDLSRVQNSIQQAEDDLRQIQVLNARIATLIR